MDYTNLQETLTRIVEQCEHENGHASWGLYQDFWFFLHQIVTANEYYFVRSASLLASQYQTTLDPPENEPTFQVAEIARMTHKLLVRMMMTARDEVVDNEIILSGYNAFADYVVGALVRLDPNN